MAIGPEKLEALSQRMKRLGIFEGDLTEKFILGSGRGGQKIQKTHSCVYLKHEPTGLEVKCQQTRSRALNRYYARHELCDKIARLNKVEEEDRKALKAKEMRKKRRPSKQARMKMVERKRRLSEKKEKRKPPKNDEN